MYTRHRVNAIQRTHLQHDDKQSGGFSTHPCNCSCISHLQFDEHCSFSLLWGSPRNARWTRHVSWSTSSVTGFLPGGSKVIKWNKGSWSHPRGFMVMATIYKHPWIKRISTFLNVRQLSKLLDSFNERAYCRTNSRQITPLVLFQKSLPATPI